MTTRLLNVGPMTGAPNSSLVIRPWGVSRGAAYTSAAHAANLAKGHPPACGPDDALSEGAPRLPPE
jgi:hypothetical protein